jgi:hypothetical protein
MIPQRFVTEYPERCGQLLDMLEPHARECDLLGSFALLVASAAFTIPFARMTEKQHPTGKPDRKLFLAIEGLKKCSFLEAPFWNGLKPQFYRYAKISTNPEHPARWRNTAGVHPINSAEERDGNTVLRTIRHALAHGNVTYLDESGHETPGNQLRYLAFLCKHESGNGHRVVIFDEESFLAFLKSWIAWLQTFPPQTELVFVEAAE